MRPDRAVALMPRQQAAVCPLDLVLGVELLHHGVDVGRANADLAGEVGLGNPRSSLDEPQDLIFALASTNALPARLRLPFVDPLRRVF